MSLNFDKKKITEFSDNIALKGKDKRSEGYFYKRYLLPAFIVAIIPAIHTINSNLFTIEKNLEKTVFVASLVFASFFILSKVRRIEIVIKKDIAGIDWPLNYHRFIDLLVFSFLISIIVVWGALNINRVIDTSRPVKYSGRVVQIKEGMIFKDSISVKVKINLPHHFTRNQSYTNIEDKMRGKLKVGSAVNVLVSDGVFNSPYILRVELLE